MRALLFWDRKELVDLETPRTGETAKVEQEFFRPNRKVGLFSYPISLALIVISALSSFEIGHPSFAA
jgi:hypothetical protein